MDEINKIVPNLFLENKCMFLSNLLYGLSQFDNDLNLKKILLTLEFIHSSKRFDMSLY